MSDFVIQTENLTKRYGFLFWKRKVPALDSLTIEIPKGAVYGFLGPNGAGKTTTIKLLMDLIKPTSGTATILGRPCDDVEVKSRIGFLPDTPSFSSQLTANEFLSVCAKLLRIPSDVRKERIQEVLDIVKMTKHAKAKIGSFSRGMLQRIGIAQAILNHPELLILDEPLLGLDPYGRQEFKEIINRQNQEFGTTVFFSSHILSDVEEICNYISILDKGRLICQGKLKDLLASGNGILVQITSCDDAVKELMSAATETDKKGPGEWELVFRDATPETERKIRAVEEKFGAFMKISSCRENLEDFFFKTVDLDQKSQDNNLKEE